MLQENIFRSAKPEDDDFVFGLYLQRRTDEIAAFGWDQGAEQSFLKMQFDMRRKAYRMRYPRADHRIIQTDGVPVGEMIVYRAENSLGLVDISISKEFRGRGIGAEAIRLLQNEADAEHLPIILHVDRINLDAQRLYQRIGFVVTDDSDEVTIEMKWTGNQM